jgi:DNA-binding MarR family transcriptional regulator
MEIDTRSSMPLQFLSPIHKASRQIAIFLEPGGERMGLSTSEAHLVTYLRSCGPCPIGELHRVFGYRRSTLTSICDRLEERWILTRRLDPEDRRSFLVDLTAEGRRLAERIRQDVEELEQAIRRHVGRGDVEGFTKVMAAIETVTEVRVRRSGADARK